MVLALAVLTAMLPRSGTAQQTGPETDIGSQPLFSYCALAPARAAIRGSMPPAARRNVAFSRLAVATSLNTLGFGIELATPLTPHTDIRVGGNFFDASEGFSIASINMSSQLHLRSTQLSLDYQPFRWLGLQISPGVLLYNGNRLTAAASVDGGSAFYPGDGSYVSSKADPVTGSFTVGLGHPAPTLTIGLGSLLPRNGRHWSIPVEAGFAYIGAPSVSLNLRGSVCDTKGQDCRAIPTAPDVLANVALEAATVQGSLAPLQLYPIASIGFAYNFRLFR